MNKTSLLERAKKLNKPRRNCMKTKEEEVSKIPSKGIRRLFCFGYPVVCMACLDELRRQQIIDQKVDRKTRMGGNSKKYSDGW